MLSISELISKYLLSIFDVPNIMLDAILNFNLICV